MFGFSYFIPVFVFVLLGPGAQLSSSLVRFLFLFWGLGFYHSGSWNWPGSRGWSFLGWLFGELLWEWKGLGLKVWLYNSQVLLFFLILGAGVACSGQVPFEFNPRRSVWGKPFARLKQLCLRFWLSCFWFCFCFCSGEPFFCGGRREDWVAVSKWVSLSLFH